MLPPSMLFSIPDSVYNKVIAFGFVVMNFELTEESAEPHIVCEFTVYIYRLSVLFDNGSSYSDSKWLIRISALGDASFKDLDR